MSEKHSPQDGRFNIKVRGHDLDVRMSTMPVQHGESVVMRLLMISRVTDTGSNRYAADLLARFRQQLQRPRTA